MRLKLKVVSKNLDLEGIERIVNAGMNDFAVARAGASAEGGTRIEDQDLSAFQRQLSCNRDAHNAGSNHYTIHFLFQGGGGRC